MTKRKNGKNWILVLGVLMSLLAISTLVVVVRSLAARPNTSHSASRPLTRVGQIAQTGQVSLRIDSVRKDEVGDDVFVPGTGMRFVVTSLSARNTGKTPVTLAPVIQAYIKDSTGTLYQMSPAPTKTPFVAGEIAPAASVTGEISFDVPAAATGLVLYYQVGQFQPAAIDLGI